MHFGIIEHAAPDSGPSGRRAVWLAQPGRTPTRQATLGLKLEPLADAGRGESLPIGWPALAARSKSAVHDNSGNRRDPGPGHRVGAAVSQIVNRHLTVRACQFPHQSNGRLTHRASSNEDLIWRFAVIITTGVDAMASTRLESQVSPVERQPIWR